MKRDVLEKKEALEQLRLLENDIPIHVVITTHKSHGVDRPGTSPLLNRFLKARSRIALEASPSISSLPALNAGHQMKLDQGPMQIFLLMEHLEIAVACQIIGKKPEPQLEGDQTNRLKNQLPVIVGEKSSRPGKVARQHLPAQIQIKRDLGEIGCRLP